MTTERVLVIGYGNPGRLDDGLGPALAAELERRSLPGVRVESNYQLSVEDATDVAEHDVVVFADASVSGAEPFAFHPVTPRAEVSFSTHSVEPEAVLAIATDMFGGQARGFALAIRGYAFNAFGEELSEAARRNLDAAVEFLVGVIENGTFDAYEARDAAPVGEDPRVVLELTSSDLN